MKKLITFSLFLISASFLGAQVVTDDYYSTSKPKLLSADRVSASISAGAGVSFLGSSNNTAFTTFIAPKIGYQMTEKFKLNVGLMHYSITGNTFMPARTNEFVHSGRPINQNEALVNTNNKSRTGNLLFVEGQYQLNKRVAVSGAVMYDANNIANRQNNFKAVSVGMDYKVSKNSTLSFRTVVSQGESPYLNGGFGGQTNPMMFDGFGGIGNEFSNRLNSSIR